MNRTPRKNDKPYRILILDDEQLEISWMTRVLERISTVETHGFRDGYELLRFVQDNPYMHIDAIILDLLMPGVDGAKMIRKLHEIQYKGNIIIRSGADEVTINAIKRLAMSHGLNISSVLTKPTPLASLETAIFQLADPVFKIAKAIHYSASEVEAGIELGELTNFYQPKVNARTGQFQGLEALVRWNHPVDGMVSPIAFVPIAEDSGLIHALTRSVLRKAFSDIRIWRQQGLSIKVHVNVSMNDLTSAEFVEFLISTMKLYDINSCHIGLEVTESRLMADTGLALENLTSLHLNAIDLSIDDFGTGHSSLKQLLWASFNELKMDRSFVSGVSKSKTKQALVDSSVMLAHRLGMRVVAEGVEEPEDLMFLQQAGCDVIQGYLIGIPMPAHHLEQWLAEWSSERHLLLCNNKVSS